MKIYIASSWRNQIAVELMTGLIRKLGHEVISWIEYSYNEGYRKLESPPPFETWLQTQDADQAFEFCTRAATTSDLVIYLSCAGKEAATEVGMAWAKNIPILGLHAQGEDFGLMRKTMKWFSRYTDLTEYIKQQYPVKENELMINAVC